MKKFLTILSLAAVCSSCTKVYTCECTSTPPSGSTSSKTSTIKSTKADAERDCKAEESKYVYTTCKLK